MHGQYIAGFVVAPPIDCLVNLQLRDADASESDLISLDVSLYLEAVEPPPLNGSLSRCALDEAKDFPNGRFSSAQEAMMFMDFRKNLGSVFVNIVIMQLLRLRDHASSFVIISSCTSVLLAQALCYHTLNA